MASGGMVDVTVQLFFNPAEGDYMCQATNEVGSVVASREVIVRSE